MLFIALGKSKMNNHHDFVMYIAANHDHEDSLRLKPATFSKK